jgi:WD40 repeat protein
MWDTRQAKQSIAEWRGHTSNVTGLAVLPDNNIVSCSTDGTVRLWRSECKEASAQTLGADLGAYTCAAPVGNARVALGLESGHLEVVRMNVDSRLLTSDGRY